MKWLRCPICGLLRLVRPSQQTCGRRCGAISVKRRLGSAWHMQNGAHAGRAFATCQADRTIAAWQAKYPGISVEAIVAIRQQGYNSGWRTGHAAGFSLANGERKKRMLRVA